MTGPQIDPVTAARGLAKLIAEGEDDLAREMLYTLSPRELQSVTAEAGRLALRMAKQIYENLAERTPRPVKEEPPDPDRAGLNLSDPIALTQWGIVLFTLLDLPGSVRDQAMTLLVDLHRGCRDTPVATLFRKAAYDAAGQNDDQE